MTSTDTAGRVLVQANWLQLSLPGTGVTTLLFCLIHNAPSFEGIQLVVQENLIEGVWHKTVLEQLFQALLAAAVLQYSSELL